MPKPTALIVAVAVLALAFLLNPSADKHRETIKAAVAERSQLERLLGIGQLTSFASRYHSLGVASYTTVGDEVVSVGAFGLVVVP